MPNVVVIPLFIVARVAAPWLEFFCMWQPVGAIAPGSAFVVASIFSVVSFGARFATLAFSLLALFASHSRLLQAAKVAMPIAQGQIVWVFINEVLIGVFFVFSALEVFAMCLESVFLSHALFFFFGLNVVSLGTIFVELALKNLIFAEFAIELAVEELNLEAGFQPYVVETFFFAADNPCLAALEFMLQPFAYGAVYSQNVGRRQSFAIGRIGDDYAGFGWLCELPNILLPKFY